MSNTSSNNSDGSHVSSNNNSHSTPRDAFAKLEYAFVGCVLGKVVN